MQPLSNIKGRIKINMRLLTIITADATEAFFIDVIVAISANTNKGIQCKLNNTTRKHKGRKYAMY